MQLVAITALGIGGSTIIGAVLGFLLKRIPHKWNDTVMGFAAGVMLAAAVVGLILPSVDMAGASGLWMVGVGMLCGALFLNALDRVAPHLHHLSGIDPEEHRHNKDIHRVLLFVMAVAIHNFPEGLAAGMAFGGQDMGNALSVAVGIALQNVPEGMVIILPMLLAGISKPRTFLLAVGTGFIEVIGTFLGYAGVRLAAGILPFALSFAGGTMLYIVGDEMIPETHSHGYERMATYAMMTGFFIMLVVDTLVG